MASSTMALARAFTKRAKRHHETTPTRGTSVRYPAGTIDRNLISLPTELISTTNVHALTAPDIATLNGSSASLIDSNHDLSDFSTIDRSFLNSPPSMSSDNSSIDSSPISPATPIEHEAKDFFAAASKRSTTVTGNRTSAAVPSLEAPAVPQRALSHSKKAHVELSRKRSTQRMSPPPNTLTQPSTTRSSQDVFARPSSSSDHPFRKELAKVNEAVEDFGGAAGILDDEEREMRSKGLQKFGVEDYLDEIAELYGGGVYEDQLGRVARPWF